MNPEQARQMVLEAKKERFFLGMDSIEAIEEAASAMRPQPKDEGFQEMLRELKLLKQFKKDGNIELAICYALVVGQRWATFCSAKQHRGQSSKVADYIRKEWHNQKAKDPQLTQRAFIKEVAAKFSLIDEQEESYLKNFSKIIRKP